MNNRLSKTTVTLHWSVALLFLGALGLGLYVEDLANSPEKFELLATHKSIGLALFVIAVMRLLWRFKEGAISSISTLPKWQAVLAKGAHYLLLLATISMPLSGIIMTIGGGRALEFFGIQLLAAGEKIEWMSGLGHFIHVQSVNIIIAVLALHIAGALKHQFLDKDGTISRMLGREV
jgi:cytochrome b561